jgi:hypothetical protein
LKTIESVVLLRSRVEELDRQLDKTNDDVRDLVKGLIQIDRRVVRLETLEEMRTGSSPPQIEGN